MSEHRGFEQTKALLTHTRYALPTHAVHTHADLSKVLVCGATRPTVLLRGRYLYGICICILRYLDIYCCLGVASRPGPDVRVGVRQPVVPAWPIDATAGQRRARALGSQALSAPRPRHVRTSISRNGLYVRATSAARPRHLPVPPGTCCAIRLCTNGTCPPPCIRRRFGVSTRRYSTILRVINI